MNSQRWGWVAPFLWVAVMLPLGGYPVMARSAQASDPWVKDNHNPVFIGSSEAWDAAVASPHVVKDAAGYRLWYVGASASNAQNGIGVAESSDGVTWSRLNSEPLLSGRGAGYWDQIVNGASVLVQDGFYQMWYRGDSQAAPDQPIQISLGYATSSDGLAWAPDPNNPVLTVGEPGSWDDTYLLSGSVLAEGTGYRMWYSACATVLCQIGLATSLDGIHWTRASTQPVLTVGPAGAWDARHVLGPVVIVDQGIHHLWYSGSQGAAPTYAIGHATSADGVTWVKDPGNPVLTPSAGTWDSQSVIVGSVVAEAGGFTLWYTGRDANWHYGIGRARQGPPVSPAQTATPTATAQPTATSTPTPTATATTSPEIRLYLPDVRRED